MTLGSLAPPGSTYVVRRDHAPGQNSGPPVYLVRPGLEISHGPYTSNLADARRWRDRSAVWGYLRRNRVARGQAGKLDHQWHMERVQDRPPPGRTSS